MSTPVGCDVGWRSCWNSGIPSRSANSFCALSSVSSVSSARFISHSTRSVGSISGHPMVAAPPASSISVVRAAVADRTWIFRADAFSRLLCRFPGLAELTVLLVSNLGVASPPLGDHSVQRLALEVHPVLVVQPRHWWQVVDVHGVHIWHRVEDDLVGRGVLGMRGGGAPASSFRLFLILRSTNWRAQ